MTMYVWVSGKWHEILRQPLASTLVYGAHEKPAKDGAAGNNLEVMVKVHGDHSRHPPFWETV